VDIATGNTWEVRIILWLGTTGDDFQVTSVHLCSGAFKEDDAMDDDPYCMAHVIAYHPSLYILAWICTAGGVRARHVVTQSNMVLAGRNDKEWNNWTCPVDGNFDNNIGFSMLGDGTLL
jgi:hypothetical protein